MTKKLTIDKEWLIDRIRFDNEVLERHLKQFKSGEFRISSYLNSSGTNLYTLGFLEFISNSDIINFQNRLSMGAKYQLANISLGGSINLDAMFASLLSGDRDVMGIAMDPKLLDVNVDYDPMSDRPLEDYPIHPGLDSIQQTFKGLQCIMSNDENGLADALEKK